jgi:outer membrane biosynthesis protein TonB
MKTQSALFKSLLFHAFVILIVSIGFIFKGKPPEMEETPIEIAFISEDDAPSIDKPKPVEDMPPPQPPAEDKPQPAPKALALPDPEPKPIAEEPKKVPPPPPTPSKPAEKPEPPEKKAEEPKPEAEPLKEKTNDNEEEIAEEDTKEAFTSVLKNLADTQPVDTTREGPQLTESPVVDRVTTGELSAFQRQLSQCWRVLPGVAQAESIAVNLTITVNRDRTVNNVEISDLARYNSDPTFRAAADNAIRAIRHPDCTPLDLPPNKYDSWNAITLNFDPQRMF